MLVHPRALCQWASQWQCSPNSKCHFFVPTSFGATLPEPSKVHSLEAVRLHTVIKKRKEFSQDKLNIRNQITLSHSNSKAICSIPSDLCGLFYESGGTIVLLEFNMCSVGFEIHKIFLVFLFGTLCYPSTCIPCKCKILFILFGSGCI